MNARGVQKISLSSVRLIVLFCNCKIIFHPVVFVVVPSCLHI